MKTHHPAFAAATAAALLLPAVAHAAVTVTSVTYNNDGASQTINANDTTTDIDGVIKLESFTDGTTTWDQFVYVDDFNESEIEYVNGERWGWGNANVNGDDASEPNTPINPGSGFAAVTDDRVDTWGRDIRDNGGTTAEYYFASGPLSKADVVFFFEYTGSGADVILIDSTGIQVADTKAVDFVADSDFGEFHTEDSTGSDFDFTISLSAATFGTFQDDADGAALFDLSDVAGIKINETSTNKLDDPMLVGFATLIPEPASLALVGVGSLLLLTGRRRDA